MLENKLNIVSSAEFAEKEEEISKRKALELYDYGKIDTLKVGSVSSLFEIHKTLFEDIYDFAGK